MGGEGGEGPRRELILNSFPFTYCALCPSQKDAKGKRAAGYIIYFHLNMEGRLTLPLPLFRGSIFSSAASATSTRVCVHTHTHHSQLGGANRLTYSSYLLSPDEGLTKGGKEKPHQAEVSAVA